MEPEIDSLKEEKRRKKKKHSFHTKAPDCLTMARSVQTVKLVSFLVLDGASSTIAR